MDQHKNRPKRPLKRNTQDVEVGEEIWSMNTLMYMYSPVQLFNFFQKLKVLVTGIFIWSLCVQPEYHIYFFISFKKTSNVF